MNKVILLLMTILVFSTCKKLDGCANNIACTEEFRSIVVELELNVSNPMIDSTKTFRKEDNKLMQTHTNFDYGNFVVLDDGDFNQLTLKEEVFISKGYYNNQEIFSEEYVIKHDCCHIIKVSGKDSINL